MPTRVRGLKRGTQSEGCQIGGIRTTQGFLRGELSGATGLRRPLQWAPTGASSGRPRRSMMDDRTLFWYHRRMSLSSRRCLGSAASSTIFRGRTSELCKPEHERVPKVECVGQDLNLGTPARPDPDSRDSRGRGSYLAPLAKLSYPRAQPRKILRDKTFAEERASWGRRTTSWRPVTAPSAIRLSGSSSIPRTRRPGVAGLPEAAGTCPSR